MARETRTSAVIQTVSQNKAFDLTLYFAKLLIRLKVRTEVVPDEKFDAFARQVQV